MLCLWLLSHSPEPVETSPNLQRQKKACCVFCFININESNAPHNTLHIFRSVLKTLGFALWLHRWIFRGAAKKAEPTITLLLKFRLQKLEKNSEIFSCIWNQLTPLCAPNCARAFQIWKMIFILHYLRCMQTRLERSRWLGIYWRQLCCCQQMPIFLHKI